MVKIEESGPDSVGDGVQQTRWTIWTLSIFSSELLHLLHSARMEKA